MTTLDLLLFPSGRSVGNCRKDAKRLSRANGIPLNQALDRVASENGVALPWAKAMVLLQQGELISVPSASFPTMTRADIQSVMDKCPGLTHFGMGLYRQNHKPLTELASSFAKERVGLLEAVDECNKAVQFLRFATRRKTLNTKRTSYGLKHSVEHYMKRLPGVKNYYVANGAFICAAVHLGFEIAPVRPGNPNVNINISERSPILEWAQLCEVNSYSLSKTKADRQVALAELVGVPLGSPARSRFG
jgi:hypothetical protein